MLAELKNNVVKFNNNSVQNALNEFFEQRKKRNEKTYKNYKLWVNEFLYVLTSKNIDTVTWEDIENIGHQDIVLYKNFLERKGNKAQTINNKFSAIRSLYLKYLTKYNKNIEQNIVNVESEVVTSVAERGGLKEDEVYNLIKFANERKFKPIIQGLFFETLFRTAVRYNAILKLQLDQIKLEEDYITEEKIWTIQAKDKRVKNTMRPISNEFYYKLKGISVGNRVFNISENTLRNTLKDFLKEYNINEDRNISLHSLKKSSVTYVFKSTGGDIHKAAQHCGNKDFNTLYEHYVGKAEGLKEKLIFHDNMYKEYDITELQNCTKEELLNLIEQSGASTIRKLVELNNNKEGNEKKESE